MSGKHVTERQIYWREQMRVLKTGFFPVLVHLFIAFAVGVAFGLGAGKGFLLAMGSE